MLRYTSVFNTRAIMSCLVLLLTLSVTAAAQEASLVVDFSQGANKNPIQGDVIWIRGILQQSNSTYFEGMSTLQRIIFVNIPKTADHVHSLTLSHLANKGTDHHAYDFLTSWPQALQAGAEIGGLTMFVNLNECGPAIGPPANLGEICEFLHTGGYNATADCPDDMAFVIGDDVAARVAAYEAHFGNRTVEIYGNTSISAATFDFEGYDALLSGADLYADYTLTWTSSSDSVIIEIGGHLAVGVDPLQANTGYGAGRGSGSISGGPYHFKLRQLDGAPLGNQDNQIQGADILIPPPVCSVTPQSDSVCVGGSATFTDHSIGGTSPYVWEWTKPPDVTVLSTDSVLTISDATPSDAGEYQVIVTDAEGLKDTCSASLAVYQGPSCELACPDPLPECHTAGNILVACVGGDIECCNWSLTGEDWSIEQACGETLFYCAGCESGTFKLVVTDVHGCRDSSEIICECEEMVPVDLTDFQAIGGRGIIVISWSTASEVNCQGWEIYRSGQRDGQYTRIAQLSGHGSSETTHSYRWADRQVSPGMIYFYKLRQLEFDGSAAWSQAVSATAGSAMPLIYALSQNYPNPFNASSQIRYQIVRGGHTTLMIYNTLGELVRTLADRRQEPGWYVVTWDGRDNNGAEVSSGLYICRLKAGDFSGTIKMVLLR